MKQILQIVAILPGQTGDQRFSIPLRKSTCNVTQVTNSNGQTDLPSKPPPSNTSKSHEVNPLQFGAEEMKTNKVSARPGAVDNGSGILRQDSITNDLDEFHDAQT